VRAVHLAELTVEPLAEKAESLRWNVYIECHHDLGDQPLPGTQMRQFARSAGQIAAPLGFGASACKTRPRDATIGWSHERRQRSLPLVVDNARFRILPRIR
jgi:hypothetical protein